MRSSIRRSQAADIRQTTRDGVWKLRAGRPKIPDATVRAVVVASRDRYHDREEASTPAASIEQKVNVAARQSAVFGAHAEAHYLESDFVILLP
jgi:hypothetical protein